MKTFAVLLGVYCCVIPFLGCGVERLTVGRQLAPSVVDDTTPPVTAPDSGQTRVTPEDSDAGEDSPDVITRTEPEDEPCVTYRKKAVGGKLDILVLYDDSVSMAIKGAYWAPLREAVVSVISTLQSDNIGIGLRWFSSQNCKAEAFMVPDIPVDTLPDNADALTSAVMNHSPASYFGGLSTQMSYAIEGTTQYMRQLAKEHPSRRHIILLVTDGEPGVDVGISACPLELKDSTIDMTVKAAAAAFKRYPSIPIYVLGVGPSLLNLNSIAKAGGTSGAFVIDSDKEAAQPVLESLVKTIRSKDLPCDYAIPVEYTTYNDPTLVNVTYNGRLIGYVGDVNQCHPEKGGWYFDNPAAPERILTCKKTCEDFSDGGDVDIVLGCEVFELI